MASNLRVDQITASTTGSISIGTATFTGSVSLPSGGVTVATGATISGSTNTIIASTNGSERVRITSAGRVGLGTDNPAVNLQVKGSASNGQIYLGGTGAHSQIYADNDGVLILSADQGNTAASSYFAVAVDNTERARITSTGNVQIANGNLVFSTSGTGIDFSAASGSAAGSTSALLDDYEEGTWTPTLLGNIDNNQPSYGSQQGSYIKVGNVVHVSAYIRSSSTMTVGSNNRIELGGFPFTPYTTGIGWNGGMTIGYKSNLVSGAIPGAAIDVHLLGPTSNNRSRFHWFSNSNDLGGSVDIIQNNSEFYISGSYRVT